MACGFGACFSCVAPIRQADGSTDLRRVCVEGPVVSADRVDWPRLAPLIRRRRAVGASVAASPPRSLLSADLIAKPGRLLIVFAGDGLVELFAQGLFDREFLADILFVTAKLVDQGGVGRSAGSCSSHQVR